MRRAPGTPLKIVKSGPGPKTMRCPSLHTKGESGIMDRYGYEDYQANNVLVTGCPLYRCRSCGFTSKNTAEVPDDTFKLTLSQSQVKEIAEKIRKKLYDGCVSHVIPDSEFLINCAVTNIGNLNVILVIDQNNKTYNLYEVYQDEASEEYLKSLFEDAVYEVMGATA